MPSYQAGDHVKVEFLDGRTGESEWMWVRVDSADDRQRIVFGKLDSQPIVNRDLRLGMELAIDYDKIREHMKPEMFHQ
jgi:hypothetical protein